MLRRQHPSLLHIITPWNGTDTRSEKLYVDGEIIVGQSLFRFCRAQQVSKSRMNPVKRYRVEKCERGSREQRDTFDDPSSHLGRRRTSIDQGREEAMAQHSRWAEDAGSFARKGIEVLTPHSSLALNERISRTAVLGQLSRTMREFQAHTQYASSPSSPGQRTLGRRIHPKDAHAIGEPPQRTEITNALRCDKPQRRES